MLQFEALEVPNPNTQNSKASIETMSTSVNLEDVPSESLMSELLRRMRCSSKPDKRLILIGNYTHICSLLFVCISDVHCQNSFLLLYHMFFANQIHTIYLLLCLFCFMVCYRYIYVVFTLKVLSLSTLYGFCPHNTIRSTVFPFQLSRIL